MKISKKSWVRWAAFFASILAVYLYLNFRENIFPVPQPRSGLENKPTPTQVQEYLRPFVNVPLNQLKFTTDTFVDRNSVKFLQKTLKSEAFDALLFQENIPLWGWKIKIEKPFHANLKISQHQQLIGYEITEGEEYLPPMNHLESLRQLEDKTTKKLIQNKENITASHLTNQEFKFQQKVPGTELMELVTLNFGKENLIKFDSSLLLPASYADVANADIQKQKTMHQFFNLFHYVLVALIFLFLFRVYDTHLLPWKKNLPLFFALYVAHFFNHLFTTEFHDYYSLSIFQALTQALGSSLWMYALFVAADLVARTYKKSNYSLSDLVRLDFYTSAFFRNSLFYGWLLFVAQLIFVGLFYKVAQSISAYVPLKIPGEHSLQCSAEFLKYFFDAFSTATYEETLYRLFLICLFVSFFKKSWPAILISSVLWGFLHFSYQFEPYYIRGLELTLVGLIYGWAMIRYGILTTVFAHFLYNSYVMAEYENQFGQYLGLLATISIGIYLGSLVYKKRASNFKFERLELPKLGVSNAPLIERRNQQRRIYPLSWKYGTGILALVVFIIFYLPRPEKDNNPLPNKDKLVQASSNIVSFYTQDDLWNITYNLHNPDIKNLREIALSSKNKKELIAAINPYSYLWAIRYYSKANAKIVCEMRYSKDYELVSARCPLFQSSEKIEFNDWVYRIKKPNETWTLFKIEPFENGVLRYQYNIEKDPTSQIAKKALLTFRNDQLVFFQKKIEILVPQQPLKQESKVSFFLSIALVTIFIGILFGFFKFLFPVIKLHDLKDRKPLYGAFISLGLFILWKLNSYKEVLINYTDGLAWKHMIFNEATLFTLKCLVIVFVSYLIFYAFIYFPAMTFKYIPTSKEWDGILKRPIWKWRNTKVSLLYAILLLCIQTLLRLLIQIDNGVPGLELFNFDVTYLNHEFIFITFLSLFWKNLVFWIVLMVVISILEKYIPRWIYLIGIGLVVFTNVWFSEASMNSKWIELCGIYIIFYFIYNLARFDFAFYFWFILLNTMMTFLPLLIYSQYSSYLYQITFIFIFVMMMMLYTLLQKKRILDLS